MRKFTFFLVLIAALLAAVQAWNADLRRAQYYFEPGDGHFKGGNLDQAISKPPMAWGYMKIIPAIPLIQVISLESGKISIPTRNPQVTLLPSQYS